MAPPQIVGHVDIPIYDTLKEDVFRTLKRDEAYHLATGALQDHPPILASFKLGSKRSKPEADLTNNNYKTLKTRLKAAGSTEKGKLKPLVENEDIRGISVRNQHLGHELSANDSFTIEDFGTGENMSEKLRESAVFEGEGPITISIPCNNPGVPTKLKELLDNGFDVDDLPTLTNTKGFERQLTPWFCYILKRGTKLPEGLSLFEDNAPPPKGNYPGHRTIAPYGNGDADVEVEVVRIAPLLPLYATSTALLAQWKLHCFLMVASAEPRPMVEGSDPEAYRLALILDRYIEHLAFNDAVNAAHLIHGLSLIDYKLESLETMQGLLPPNVFETVLDAALAVAEFNDHCAILTLIQKLNSANIVQKPENDAVTQNKQSYAAAVAAAAQVPPVPQGAFSLYVKCDHEFQDAIKEPKEPDWNSMQQGNDEHKFDVTVNMNKFMWLLGSSHLEPFTTAIARSGYDRGYQILAEAPKGIPRTNNDKYGRSALVRCASLECKILCCDDPDKAVFEITTNPRTRQALLCYLAAHVHRQMQQAVLTTDAVVLSARPVCASTNSNNIAISKLNNNFSSSKTYIKLFDVGDLDISTGIETAINLYKALRFMQTQIRGTKQKFMFLFTSPDTRDLALTMLDTQEWKLTIKSELRKEKWILEKFSIHAKDLSMKSKAVSLFLFMSWDSKFHAFGQDELTVMLKNLGIHVQDAQSFDLHTSF